MSKILVTGHKGYIGSHLYSEIKKGLTHEVHGIDLKDGDDALYCLPDEQFDTVFHFCAYPRVEYSVLNPSYTLQQNVLVTSKLLEWSKNHGVKKFIFSSSSAIMGDGDGVPKSPYGLHKLMSEMECKLYKELYGVHCVCLRYFNAYSEDQPYGGAYTTAISAWMEMIRQNKPLRLDGDGEQTRDFVHVEDIVSANILAMNNSEMDDDYYNVGYGFSFSLNYIKDFIDRHQKVEWDFAPPRKGDARNTLANNQSLIDCGWKPKVHFNEGLERCFGKVLL
jgi:UDP-glucose 4-epimerase